jgi:hypothetical protein
MISIFSHQRSMARGSPNKGRRPVYRGANQRAALARFLPRLEPLEERAVPSYVFTTIDNPNTAGFPGDAAFGIDAPGKIVGFYADANNAFHGYLLNGGQYTTLDDPNGGAGPLQGTEANGISASGKIVGTYTDPSYEIHGYLLNDGAYTTLDDPNAGTGFLYGTSAQGINDRGQIVGYYVAANNVAHGFLLSRGQYTTLDDANAGSQGSQLVGINESGEMVGDYYDTNDVGHGYLISHGQSTTLDDPNAGTGPFQGSNAFGMNASGQIVGPYRDANGVWHGFVLSGGHYTTLDDPNAGTGSSQGTEPFGINNSGQIVGFYYDAKGVAHGFLATPGSGNAALPAGDRGARSGLASAGGITNALESTSALTSVKPTPNQSISDTGDSRSNGGDRVSGVYTDQSTAFRVVLDTIDGEWADVLFAARATASTDTIRIAYDLFTSKDNISVH